MGILQRIFGRAPRGGRVMVLGLDGLPLALARRAAGEGSMPNLAEVLAQGFTVELEPVLPAVNTVTWATYATGVNPGWHGVFGFVDRQPNPFQVHFPTAEDLKSPTLWEILSRAGKRVGVINVPLTYPPKKVNGFMVACFLSPELAKATYPVELAPRLMEMDYRIEAETALATSDPGAFLADLAETLGRRFTAAFHLMESEPWDFFHLHLSGPDWVNHLLWGAQDGRHEELREEFWSFYRKLDTYLGELVAALPGGCSLILVSDHGFEPCQAHVYLNHWLEKNGYLLFRRGRKELLNMHPDTRAYSLVPGRIYLNLAGREERGSVARGRDYEDLRQELIHRLSGLSHPETGQPLVKAVHRREEIYQGPLVEQAADLIVEPAPGFELKATLGSAGLLGEPDMPGMHSAQGAFVHLHGLRNTTAWEGKARLEDLAPTILKLMGVAVPDHLEGQPLV